MPYLILVISFLIQFLVILGALISVIFFARPEVPLLGDGTEERFTTRGRDQRLPERMPPTSGRNASRNSWNPTRPPVLAAFRCPSYEVLYEIAAQWPSMFARNSRS
jgi:hypothetical protein